MLNTQSPQCTTEMRSSAQKATDGAIPNEETGHGSRLLAKHRFRNNQSSALGASINHNGKRLISSVTSADRNPSASAVASASQSQPKALRPLPNMIGKFVDYDLSTMKNSKGGFLLDSEEDDVRALKQRRQIEELKNQRLQQAERYKNDPSISLQPGQNPNCKVCGTIELDFQIYQIFRVPVCQKCRNANPDRFSLLTKTECKEDYLLTDPELKDSELLPHLLKANPHQSTFSNMMLFLREQVEAYAFSDRKWGSSEALDREFERREGEKRKKKNKKFEERLKELRKRTRSNVWHKRQEAIHVHSFNKELLTNSKGVQVQKCTGCGIETECEIF